MTRRTPNRDLLPADFLEVSERVSPVTLFLTFHFPETHTNLLTSPYVDPQSKCPEYKVTAVAIEPLRGETA
jgi:formate dehydrogenase major subunit